MFLPICFSKHILNEIRHAAFGIRLVFDSRVLSLIRSARNGMINVSPVGRNASTAERHEFEAFDKQHNIRSKMVEALKAQFPDYGLT